MMPTKELIEIQNWYIRAMEYASLFAHFPVQRRMYAHDAQAARDEFLETYGVELPL